MPQRRAKGEGNIGRRKDDGLWYARIDLGCDNMYLRHTCASLLVAAGHHPRVVMETLGHSQIGITMDTYAHVYAGALRAVAETMDTLLPGAGVDGTDGSEQSSAVHDARECR